MRVEYFSSLLMGVALVSGENTYAEALFRTANYRPEFPVKDFIILIESHACATSLVHWYNFDHRHGGSRYVSPAQRHAGKDHTIPAAGHARYVKAHERYPVRWSHTRGTRRPLLS